MVPVGVCFAGNGRLGGIDMTENEAIEKIKYRMHTAEHVAGECGMEDLEMAVKALEEIQQYRAIGTVKEFQTKVVDNGSL